MNEIKEKKQPSVVLNYIYNVVYEIFILIIPFVTAAYTSRVFEADGVGQYSFSNTIASYAILIGSLGVASYGQRECSRLRDDKRLLSNTFWEIFFLKACSVFLCLLLYLIPAFLATTYSIYLKAFSILVLASIFDISWFYRGIENFKWVSFWQIVIKTISTVCLFIFVKEKSDLVLYILFISFSTLFGNLMMWLFMKRYLQKVPFRELRPTSHLKNTFVYFIPTIATSIYTQLDKLMIGWMTRDDYQNGYYEQATKVVSMGKTLVLSVNVVVSARMSYLFQNKNFEEIKKRLLKTAEYIMLLSLPLSIGIIAVAKDFVPVFFGDGFEGTIPLLYILSPIIFVVGISNVLGACYFTPSGQRAKSNKVIVSGAIINLLLNLLLIFHFKSIGAAISSLVAETFIAIVYLIMGREWLPIKSIAKMLIKKLIAGVVMGTLVLLYSHFTELTILNLIIEILVGMLAYFIILLILRDAILFEIIKRFIHIFRRKKAND